MSGYERAQLATLLARIDEAPQRPVIVTGPRQTGKTTLVRQALDRIDRPSRYLSADELDPAGARESRWPVREWEGARAAACASDRGFVLALDEIRKVRGRSEAVKGLWDADRRQSRRLHVVLLGSSPMRVREGMGESLAGRFETVRLAQWSFGEMAAAFGFDLARYVYFGGYPGAAPLAGDEERWRAYVREALVAPAIERDVLAARRVEKPALMKRPFELGAEYSEQILSYNKMLGQLQDSGNAATPIRYLDLLADTGMIAGLPRFALASHRRRAASPKLVVLDTGLAAALSGDGFAEARANGAFRGRPVESAVGAHLFNPARWRSACVTGGRTAGGGPRFAMRAQDRCRRGQDRRAPAERGPPRGVRAPPQDRAIDSCRRGRSPLVGVPVDSGARMAGSRPGRSASARRRRLACLGSALIEQLKQGDDEGGPTRRDPEDDLRETLFQSCQNRPQDTPSSRVGHRRSPWR